MRFRYAPIPSVLALFLTISHPLYGVGPPTVQFVTGAVIPLTDGPVSTGEDLGFLPAACLDVDGDGHVDLALVNGVEANLIIALGDGSGGFSLQPPVPLAAVATSVATGDLDQDGEMDIVAVHSQAGLISVIRGAPGTSFQPPVSIAVGPHPVSATIAPLTDDAYPDLLLVDQIESTVDLLVSDGTGGFAAPVTGFVEIDDSLEAVTVADVDQDGFLDLVVPCPVLDTLAVVRGLGGGQFAPAEAFPVGLNPRSVAIADLDDNGLPDLATTNRDSDQLAILYGQADGSFANSQGQPGASFLATGDQPEGILCTDTQGDGNQDVVFVNAGDGTVSILSGEHGPFFGAPLNMPLGGSLSYVVKADFDEDGRIDLAVVDSETRTLTILINVTGGNARFLRGDANGDAQRDIADGVTILSHLFGNGPAPWCLDAADTDDSGTVDLGDAILLLSSLFEGPPLPLQCSVDATLDLLDTCPELEICP